MAIDQQTSSTSSADEDVRAKGSQYEFSPDLVVLSDTRLSEAEAVRTIRTHVIARHIHQGRRGLALCAASRDVGCTFTAVNLAVSLAQSGTSTLLIDADMRSPSVERFIKPLRPVYGLKDCISLQDPVARDCIQNEVLPNLSVLYSGGHADDAQEMLTGDPFRRLIERCMRDFEFTVIDTPPMDSCADARRIGTMIGYALVVARANVSLMSDVRSVAERLQEDGTRVVGTVLNEV